VPHLRPFLLASVIALLPLASTSVLPRIDPVDPKLPITTCYFTSLGGTNNVYQGDCCFYGACVSEYSYRFTTLDLNGCLGYNSGKMVWQSK
jgi:hypothetical protein